MSTTGETPASVSVPETFEQRLARRGVAQLWLALLTLTVYCISLTFGFVYDDRKTVINNPWIESWSKVPQYFTSGDLWRAHGSNFYRPLSALYCRVMNAMFGMSAAGWHAGSVLLHLLCVLLTFALARQLLRSRAAAFLAAALFAVHPTHVEAVTWVSAAGDPLMTMFLLAAAVAFLHWRQGETPVWLAGSLVAGAAALFTKETAVVMPVLLSAFLLLPTAIRSRRVQLAALAAFWFEDFAFLAIRGHILHGFSHPISGATTLEMLLTWPAAIAFYVRHMFFPWEMTPFYPFDFVHSADSPEFLLPLLALLVLAAAVAWLMYKATNRRLYLACLAWIAVPLAPVMYLKLFPQYQLVHDRYLYISTIGLCIAAAAAITSLAHRAEPLTNVRLLPLTSILLVAVSAAATVGYESWWQSEVTLFKRAVSITPNNFDALLNLGVALTERKQYDAGISILDRALRQKPDDPGANFDRGFAALEIGDNGTAERCLERAVQAPDVARWVFLATVKLRVGKPKECEFAARQALALDPAEPNAQLALGLALLDEGNKAAAISEFEELLRQHPDSPRAQQALERARARN